MSKPRKTNKTDHSFYNTISPKKSHSFHEPQLTQRYKKDTPVMELNMFLVGVKKIIFTEPFLDAQELHSRSTLRANISAYFCKSFFDNFCSRDEGNFYRVEDWIISFRQIAIWDCKMFSNFSFWFKFLEFEFWHFDTSINNIKTLKFSRHLDFKGNILGKFLLRIYFINSL